MDWLESVEPVGKVTARWCQLSSFTVAVPFMMPEPADNFKVPEAMPNCQWLPDPPQPAMSPVLPEVFIHADIVRGEDPRMPE